MKRVQTKGRAKNGVMANFGLCRHMIQVLREGLCEEITGMNHSVLGNQPMGFLLYCEETHCAARATL